MFDESICFVLMPFAEEFRLIYDQGIFPAVEAFSKKHKRPLKCLRADEIARPSAITRDIVEAIFAARIIVSDLTGNNPNVFYETGIAHSVGNKTIMIAQDPSRLPFDLRSYRVIPYSNDDVGLAVLKKELIAAFDQVYDPTDFRTNPVQDYAPFRHQECDSPPLSDTGGHKSYAATAGACSAS